MPPATKRELRKTKERGGRIQRVGSFKVIHCFILPRIPKCSKPQGNQERSGSNLSCSHRCMTPRPGIEESLQKYIYTTRSIIIFWILYTRREAK